MEKRMFWVMQNMENEIHYQNFMFKNGGEIIYDKDNNASNSNICKMMTAQDYVDENGVYHEPTFESMILERDYGN